MPHKAYGIDWPLYQEPKSKTGGRATGVTSPASQPSLTEGAHFWPPEGLPFARSLACIEIVLKNSQEAKIPYNKAIDALLTLPGCQALVSEFKNFLPNIESYASRMIVEGQDGITTTQLFKMFADVYRQFKDDADCQEYFSHIQEFVLTGFNRQQDRADQRYKVIPELSKAGLTCPHKGYHSLS